MDESPVKPPPKLEEIVWEESEDVYRPARRPLGEFLSSVSLGRSLFRLGLTSVFVRREALECLISHSKSGVFREQGGILLGQAFEESTGEYYVVISKAIPARETVGTPTHLRFSVQSWEVICGERRPESDEVILGWYHTHPGLGVFMSGTDRKTQRLFFRNPWQVAVVIDPRTNEVGFFCGEDANPVRHVRVYEDLSGSERPGTGEPGPDHSEISAEHQDT